MKRLILYFALWFSMVSTAHCVHFYDSVVERGSLVSLAVVPPVIHDIDDAESTKAKHCIDALGSSDISIIQENLSILSGLDIQNPELRIQLNIFYIAMKFKLAMTGDLASIYDVEYQSFPEVKTNFGLFIKTEDTESPLNFESVLMLQHILQDKIYEGSEVEAFDEAIAEFQKNNRPIRGYPESLDSSLDII